MLGGERSSAAPGDVVRSSVGPARKGLIPAPACGPRWVEGGKSCAGRPWVPADPAHPSRRPQPLPAPQMLQRADTPLKSCCFVKARGEWLSVASSQLVAVPQALKLCCVSVCALCVRVYGMCVCALWCVCVCVSRVSVSVGSRGICVPCWPGGAPCRSPFQALSPGSACPARWLRREAQVQV